MVSSPRSTPISLLLVEDHDGTRIALERILRRHGFHVVAAVTAQEAKTCSERFHFDIVVSDIGLPDRSGLELMEELKMSHPNLPGIALTAYGTAEDSVRAHKAGFSAHLVKPVDYAHLEKTILQLAS